MARNAEIVVEKSKEMVVMIVVSFIPIILYLLILKSLDSFKLVRWRYLVVCLLSGAVCCALVDAVDRLCVMIGIVYWSPLVEEALKAVAAVMVMRRMRITFLAEAMCYGAAIGGGFATVENIMYVVYNPSMLAATVLFRGLGTAMLHIGCTALFLSVMIVCRYRNGESERRGLWLWAVGCVLPSMAIHVAYNMLLLPPLLMLLIVVVVYMALFLMINNYSERCVSRWLDDSLTYDVTLLADIREGQLSSTRTGRYLMSVRERFDAEVFFDMICFIQLYLELLISGKSRIMLREAGLPVDETEKERLGRKERIREFYVLRSRIGITAEMVLRPIVRLTHANLRIMGV